MWIGIILAGDGNIDACIQFDTREEAEVEMDKLLHTYFDPTYDRVLIEAPQTLAQTIEEYQGYEDENALYEP